MNLQINLPNIGVGSRLTCECGGVNFKKRANCGDKRFGIAVAGSVPRIRPWRLRLKVTGGCSVNFLEPFTINFPGPCPNPMYRTDTLSKTTRFDCVK